MLTTRVRSRLRIALLHDVAERPVWMQKYVEDVAALAPVLVQELEREKDAANGLS